MDDETKELQEVRTDDEKSSVTPSPSLNGKDIDRLVDDRDKIVGVKVDLLPAGGSSDDVQVEPATTPRHGRTSTWPVKTTVIASLLTVAGTVCLIAGFVSALMGKQAGVPLMLVGVLCAVPGCYQSFVLWKKFKGDPGYMSANLPTFDD